MRTQILVAANPSPVSQPVSAQIALPVDSLVLTGVVFLGTVVSNLLGWFATRAVATADRRIDQNVTALNQLTTQYHELEKKVAEQYVPRSEFTHRLSLIDAHLEQLGTRAQEQMVILKSIEVTLAERFRDKSPNN